MTHPHSTIESLARKLCADANGNWQKRRAYWTRKALAYLGIDE